MNTTTHTDRWQLTLDQIDYSSIPEIIRPQVEDTARRVASLVYENQGDGLEVSTLFDGLQSQGINASIISKVLNFLKQNGVLELVGLHKIALTS